MELDERAFVPASLANALRREALGQLNRMQLDAFRTCDAQANPMPESPQARETAQDGRILLESADTAQLLRALQSGADGILYAPEDVRREALEQAAQALQGARWSLAVPMVLAQDALNTVWEFVQVHADAIESVYLSNIAHLAMQWPVPAAGDFGLNIANRHALETLYERGIEQYTPSVELTAAQIRTLGGKQTLIVHGRLPLMQLRHCPYLAAQPGVKHADCTRCDRCAPEKRVSGSVLIDRKGKRFPLRRIASENGCIVRVMNADALMLLRRAEKLPKAYAYRIIAETGENVPALIRLYRAALNGMDVRSDPDFEIVDSQNTTTGHYFRGVE